MPIVRLLREESRGSSSSPPCLGMAHLRRTPTLRWDDLLPLPACPALFNVVSGGRSSRRRLMRLKRLRLEALESVPAVG